MTQPQVQTPATPAPVAAPLRERILIGGPSGASKTYSFLQIVRHRMNARHIAIEVDDGFERILITEFPDIPARIMDYDSAAKTWGSRVSMNRGDTLTVYHCRTFTEVMAAQREIETGVNSKTLNSESWISVDGIDLMYNNMRYELIDRALARRHYSKKKEEMSVGDEWEEALEVRGRGAPLLEGGDWDMIHSFYERFLTYLVFRITPNIYVTCSVTLIQDKSPYEDEGTKKFYEALGVPLKFEGQKRTPRVFDTLLAMTKNPGGYYVSIWKDRGGQGRKHSQGKNTGPAMMYSNRDFFVDVGQGLLGWS
jgi:hypothetical protein